MQTPKPTKTQAEFLRDWNNLHQKDLILLALTIVVIFILPSYLPSPLDTITVLVGAASSLTLNFSLNPQYFRSRHGSLKPATYLIVAMWMLAVVVSLLLLFGKS